MKTRLIRNAGREVLGTVLMVIVALAIGAILVVLSGNEPGEAYGMMLKGAFGSTQKITELFVKLIPTLTMALGVSIAFRAQLWNIGAEGQFIMGSICSMVVALYVPLPIPIRSVVAFLVAMLAGAAWAGLAGWLKTRFNANEVITTMMFNYIASYLLLYLINGPMQDPYSDLSQTDLVPEGMRLTKLFTTYRLNTGIFMLLAVVLVMLFFWRTTLGYRINLVGQGEKVATYSGVNVKQTVVVTMCISGAFSGLAGYIETFGINYRLLDGIAGDAGNIATIVALLGSLNVYGIIAAAMFFSVLLCGGASMQRMTEVPYSVVDIIQGLIIILVIAKNTVMTSLGRWLGKLGAAGRKEKEHHVE